MAAGGYCKDCVSGTIHDGEPTGEIEWVHGLDTYVAGNTIEEPKAIIVIIADAFGWDFNNNRILADNLAKKTECKVLLPDFFVGTAMPGTVLDSLDMIQNPQYWFFSKIGSVLHTLYHFPSWAYYNREAAAKPRVYDFFRSLRRDNPSLKIGAAGYCWGGKWVTHLCANRNNPTLDPSTPPNTQALADTANEAPLIDAGFTAHPSNQTLPADYVTLQKPLSVANGTADFHLTPDKMDVIRKVFELKKEGAPECELAAYEGAKHGFAVRWDPKNEREQKQGGESEDQAVRWFARFLG